MIKTVTLSTLLLIICSFPVLAIQDPVIRDPVIRDPEIRGSVIRDRSIEEADEKAWDYERSEKAESNEEYRLRTAPPNQ